MLVVAAPLISFRETEYPSAQSGRELGVVPIERRTCLSWSIPAQKSASFREHSSIADGDLMAHSSCWPPTTPKLQLRGPARLTSI
ncbi:hypothetical protein M513_04467 [Trichuris suis]|uniref:Uncharacterized protein n=1 Tax=Trichuris suis TaxID=68888 RepID=A0A085MC21_9BILA|nr:hypothetical protein M513_04467 [Trichuris suis]